MRALMFLALALVNIALLIHLTENVLGFRKRWRNNKLLVNDHPEMKSVDPDQGLMAFESDDVTRAFVLDNDAPGASEPFLVGGDEESEEAHGSCWSRTKTYRLMDLDKTKEALIQ